jgi:hypothetical protein
MTIKTTYQGQLKPLSKGNSNYFPMAIKTTFQGQFKPLSNGN